MNLKHWMALAVGIMVTTISTAQNRPADAATPNVPAAGTPIYESAFAGYKSFREPEVMPWREANEQVKGTGAMAGHDMGNMKMDATAPVHDMSQMKSAAGKTANQAMPGMDMGTAKNPDQGKEKGNASGGAGNDVGPPAKMPGHDMSMMGAPAAKKPNGQGAAQDAPAKQSSMPGHDMSQMEMPSSSSTKGMPVKGASKKPAQKNKPATESPSPMDHNMMKDKQ
jgi:hypothetical protein